jgi:hypothetical protein
MKLCPICNTNKKESEFYPIKVKHRAKDKLVTYSYFTKECKGCRRALALNRYYTNPATQRDYILRKNYGLSLNDYNCLVEKQEGKCAICGKEETAQTKTGINKTLAVDHCHSTGEVRGLLCQRCNVAIGLLGDNLAIYENCQKYLQFIS